MQQSTHNAESDQIAMLLAFLINAIRHVNEQMKSAKTLECTAEVLFEVAYDLVLNTGF